MQVRGTVVYAKRHSRPGNVSPGESTHFRPKGTLAGVWLARGKHPLPVRPKSSVPAVYRVSVTSPRTGLGETPYTTTVSSLCTNGVVFPYYPSHQLQEGSPPRSGLCRRYGVAYKNKPHNTLNQQ